MSKRSDVDVVLMGRTKALIVMWIILGGFLLAGGGMATSSNGLTLQGGDPTGEPVSTTFIDLNQSKVENLTLQFINAARTQYGLEPLESDKTLREMARFHSERMATHDVLAHTVGNVTFDERLEKFDTSCRGAAENIAQTFFKRDVRTDAGRVVHFDTERELARGLVNQWMNSTGHRRNILGNGTSRSWASAGVGIAMNDSEVYATVVFCDEQAGR